MRAVGIRARLPVHLRRPGHVPLTQRAATRAATTHRYTVGAMSLRTAVAHRNLLYLLSLKELRTRYKKSVLGWAWSLLNPLTQMVIFRHLPVRLQGRRRRSATRAVSRTSRSTSSRRCCRSTSSRSRVGVSIGAVQGGAGLIKKVAVPARAPRVLGDRRPVRDAADRARRADRRAADRRQHGAAVAAGAAASILVLLAFFTHRRRAAARVGERLLPRRQLPLGHPRPRCCSTPRRSSTTRRRSSASRALSRSPTTARPAASSPPCTTSCTTCACRASGACCSSSSSASASFVIGAWVFNRLSPRFAEEM